MGTFSTHSLWAKAGGKHEQEEQGRPSQLHQRRRPSPSLNSSPQVPWLLLEDGEEEEEGEQEENMCPIS